DLGRPEQIDALRLAWARPHARKRRVEYFVGGDAIQFPDNPGGYWLPCDRSVFRGRGGTQTLSLGSASRVVRFVRVQMYASSHSARRGSSDVRDRLGFAVRELWVGAGAGRGFHDLMRQSPRGVRQTVT